MLANRVRNSLLLLATLAVGAIAIAGEFLGSIQTTRIPTSYPVKGVTIGPYNCDYNGTDQTPIVQALAAGHKHLDIVGPGTFTFTAPVTSSLDDITISSRSGVTLVPVASGSVGLFDFTGNNIELRGLNISVPTFVASQNVIRLTGRNLRILDNTWDCTDSTATGFTAGVGPSFGHGVAFLVSGNTDSGLATFNPMQMLGMYNASAKFVSGNTWYPNKGVTCLYSEGLGSSDAPSNLLLVGNAIRSKHEAYLAVHTQCYRGFDLNGEEYSTLIGNNFFQLGTLASPMDALFFFRLPIQAGIEGGHIAMIGNQIERCVGPSLGKLWGVPSCSITGGVWGLNGQIDDAVNAGADAAGEAALILTGHNGAVGGTPCGVVTIGGGLDMHNLAKTGTDGAFIFAQRVDSLNITGMTFGVCVSNQAVRIASAGCARPQITGCAFRSNSGAAKAIYIEGANNIADGVFIGNNGFEGFTTNIVDDSNAGASGRRKILSGVQDLSSGNEAVVSYTSTATIAAADADTITDSANGLGFLAVNDVVQVFGWTGAGATANVGIATVVGSPAAGSIDIKGLTLTADAATAGEAVTIRKLSSLGTTNVKLDK